MISFLINLLLTPFFPQLIDPQVKYSSELSVIVQQVEKDNLKVPVSPGSQSDVDSQNTETDRSPPIALTAPISGKLLSNLMTSHAGGVGVEGDSNSVEVQLGQLTLTGILKVGNERVAVISDGVKDLVVTDGSYIRNSMRVVQVKKDSVALRSLETKGGDKLVELHMNPNDVPGDVE